ncbi:MAG: hypothetical protein OXC62_00935 [Aestuariivita sp.]|nr:hypothetical protein [Aestuariivita sp.]
MPNNPVQIILNNKDFLRSPEPGQRGPGKDFFENNDQSFQRHREKLISSIDRVEATIKRSKYQSVYLNVKMREEAFAKSYRPIQKVFEKIMFPCVGADNVGMLYFHAPRQYIPILRENVRQTEDTVKVNISRETQKPYKSPSRGRSEVGAIQSIDITQPTDKWDFSVTEALEVFKHTNTVSGYLVELFEIPHGNGVTDHGLSKSLLTLLIELGPGAITLPLHQSNNTLILELQLTCGIHDAIASLDRNKAIFSLKTLIWVLVIQ